MYRRILVPTDGSSCSEEAARHALKLAKELDAEVTFLTVLDPLPPTISAEVYSYAGDLMADLRRGAEASLAQALALAAEAGATAKTVLVERTRPSDGILAAMKDYDLVVMGSHGRSGVSRLLLGSVTEGVMRQSTRPLLVVRCHDRG